VTKRSDELESFKTGINLSEYAAAQGYEIDPKASGAGSVAMKHPNGDKIILGLSSSGHWIYWSVHDESDNGSIIDFIQHRTHKNLGQVRIELRPWLGTSDSPTTLPARPPFSSFAAKLEHVPTDLLAVRSSYEAAQRVDGFHHYLCSERLIPAPLLASDRFAGRIGTDERGNALFPHQNIDDVICGYEIKNHKFTGFSKHGTKGLWGSRKKDSDRRLVVAETGIDALSYAALFGYEDARFVSIAGQMNPQQPGLLNREIRAMPQDSIVVLALDNDEGGKKLAEYIEPIFANVVQLGGRSDLTLLIDSPATPGADWNDELRSRSKRPPQPSGGGRPGPE